MEEQSLYRCQVAPTPKGPLVELTYQEAESLMLKRLNDMPEDSTQTLWQLAQFYKVSKQHEKALERLRQLMQRLSSLEDKASCVFTMGQAMEQVGDFVAAARYYQEAFAMEPASTFTWYFLHNNLGYCLCKTGQFAQAEGYCRKAIEIDLDRANGHKNLGLALAGQGRYQEAAQAYIVATIADAADPRSLHLLDELLKQHSELEYEFGGDLECCRLVVESAAREVKESKPVVVRGWRKHLLLLQAKIRSKFQKLRGRTLRPEC